MSITRVNKLGTTNNTSSGLHSLILTVAATTTAFNRVIVPIVWGAQDVPSAAVSDSQGNLYVLDAHKGSTTAAAWLSVFSTRADAPLTSAADTITITWSGGTVNDAMMAAYEYSGLANFSPVDQTSTANGASTAANSGNITTTHANELLFGLIAWTTPNISAHSGTQLDYIHGTSHTFESLEQIVSSTGTYAATGTLQPNPDWAAAIVGYADIGAAQDPANTTAPIITGSAVVGMQVTCSQGFWTNTPTAYSYQWKRDGSDVATGAHYLIVSGDVGHTLSCVVSASNKYGSTDAAASNTVSP